MGLELFCVLIAPQVRNTWSCSKLPMLSVKEGRIKSVGTKGKKLSMKMVEFIDLYMIHMNAIKAATLSSYKTKNPGQLSVQLLRHPLVIEEIQRRMEIRSAKSEITAEFLIQKLIEVIDDPEIKTSDMLRAVELAGKSIALWKERQEISGPDGSAIQHEQRVKESVNTFTDKISKLAERNGDNVVPFKQSIG